MSENQPVLGRDFNWLWAAFAVSTFGSSIAFDALPLIAILALHAGPAAVSALAAVGLAVGALVAIPMGPWVEFHRKRPAMIAMDLIRFAAVASIPAAFALGRLGYVQLLVVAVIVGAGRIVYRAASGAYLKAIVPPAGLVVANGRLESVTWMSLLVGPPLGGVAIGLFGPVVTTIADAVSYLLSAAGIAAIGGREAPPPVKAEAFRLADLAEGWRAILASPALAPLFFNSVLVAGLIMATAPLLAVLMLGPLGFKPWQYGLVLGLPCLGGVIGSRLARPLAARFGEFWVLQVFGVLRACWSVGLVFVGPGTAGLALVILVEFGLIGCMGVFNPVFAAWRLNHSPEGKAARVLSAWNITSNLTIAALTALWGLLAAATSPRIAIGLAGALMLLTPLLLPRRDER
ncbi:MFS family permease [Caulobacter ginsengisoli]|uniref:MFS family permease n=1 Tax=Caulobacter ginsengisoli TaxID=400775 RepID=A0ABU0IP20_9CAUL|nr:MFS transporter [Caulobacter ginsengisoli]MDQ0463747.1 MFS family permease [Caulobacter ginsengisoli]